MGSYKKLIYQILKEELQEMARIPVLFKLTSTDPTEISSKIPDSIKKSSVTQRIIDFFQENGNTPSKITDFVKYADLPAQQAANTQFQRLRDAGVLSVIGFAAQKSVKPVSGLGQGRPIASLDTRSDQDKIKYILSKLKTGEPADAYKNWFIQQYGQDVYSQLASLVKAYQASITKDEANKIKDQLKKLFQSIGIEVGQRGRKPSADKIINNEPEEEEEKEFEPTDDELRGAGLSDDDLAEYGSPEPTTKPRPGIKEPDIKPTPKRRPLTPPSTSPKTKPKAESIVDKITNRYKNLK